MKDLLRRAADTERWHVVNSLVHSLVHNRVCSKTTFEQTLVEPPGFAQLQTRVPQWVLFSPTSTDILVQMILCCRGLSVLCTMFSSSSGLYALKACGIPLILTTKMSSDIAKYPLGHKAALNLIK